MDAKEDAHGGQDRGREVSPQEKGLSKHERINHAAVTLRDTPSFEDAEFLARAGYELIPLRSGSKAPRDKDWPRRTYDTTQVIAEARRREGNLGVRLRPTDLVIDVDPRNGGDESVARLAADLGLDLDAFPHVTTGGGGHHYYLRKPADVPTVGGISAYRGIDFKTVGGQVVAPGAVHPDTGRRYVSDFWLLGPNETPQVPDALLDLLRIRRLDRPEGYGHDRWGEITPEVLAANLEMLDPDDFDAHDDWLTLMMACHHATAGEGRQEFIDWSTEGAGYEDHAEVIGKRWDSLHATASRGGRPVTVAHLFGLIIERGKAPIDRAAAGDDFETADSGEPAAGRKRGRKRQPANTADLDALKSAWVWVGDASVFIRRHDLKRYKPEQWKSMFAHLWEGGDILSKVWKSSGFVPKFESLTYLPQAAETPDGEDGGRYNLWRPSGINPVPGDVSWFLDHMTYIVPDERERGLILDYLAHLVQHPDEKIHFALLLQGVEGTGKSAIGEVMRRIIGDANVAEPKNDELLEKWTGWQERAQLAIVSELMTLGRMEVANRLKPVITDPKLRIEEKFQVTYTIDNHLNLICFTNHRDAIKLSSGDRRWFVVFSPARPRDGDYYEGLFERIHGDGPAHVAHWLMHRDLSGFNAKGRAPTTSAKGEMLTLTMGEVENHLHELLRDGVAPFDFDLVTIEDVEDAIPESIRRETKRLRTIVRKFLIEVAEAEQHSRNTNSRGRAASLPNAQLWSIRNHGHWGKVGATERILAHAAHMGLTEQDLIDMEEIRSRR